MKLLNGQDLVDYIKERQKQNVRSLIQSQGLQPRLAIVRTNPDPVVDSYMRLKSSYAEDISVVVDIYDIDQSDAIECISKLNKDSSVNGIIVQLPLPNPDQTNEVLNSVCPEKDVDGLATKSQFDPPTPTAINWLLAGYNIDLRNKSIVVVGNGKLVGKPLVDLWSNSGLDVVVLDRKSTSRKLSEEISNADIIVSATGVPGVITAKMIKPTAVIVDAGVATDSNGLIGDVSSDVRELPDITITPEKGGVGPLTICALFENVIRATTPSS